MITAILNIFSNYFGRYLVASGTGKISVFPKLTTSKMLLHLLVLMKNHDCTHALQYLHYDNRLTVLNARASILTTQFGNLNPALVYGINFQDNVAEQNRKGNHDIHQSRCKSHVDDGLQSVTIPLARPVVISRFIDIIESLPSHVYRIKGVFNSLDAASAVLFQYVNGRYDFAELSNPKLEKRFLTVIGQDIDKEQLAKMFAITQS